jgi:small-conductance mechanosensitive channel
LLESGEPWFAAAETLLVGVAIALAVGVGLRLLARRLLRDEDRAQRTSLLAFWGVVAIFGLVAVTRLIGGATAESGLTTAGARLFATLPDLVVALVIVVAGSVLAAATRAAVRRSLASGRPRYADPIAALASGGVLVVAVLLGARQVGVETGLADAIAVAVAAGALLAAALAVGLGGRGIAEAWAAGRHASDVLTVGDVVEVDGRRGRVLRLGPTSVRLALDGGVVAEVPNSLLLQATVLVFATEEEDSRPVPVQPRPDVERAATGEEGEDPAEEAAVSDVDDEAPTRAFRPAPAVGATAEPEPGPDLAPDLAPERGPASEPEPEPEPEPEAAAEDPGDTRVLEPGWRQRAEAARAALARAEEEHRAATAGSPRDDDGPPTEAFEAPER